MLSKAQVDKLGERLRDGALQESDLRLLDDYRREAAAAYEHVVERLRSMGLETTGRPAKSTLSIVDKLRRERCRLSQMQDIAGCRIVVPSIAAQEHVSKHVDEQFPGCLRFDRRAHPSHGYRAMHLVVRGLSTPVEIQVRTEVQHRWAEFSEKASDKFGSAVKYGGGSQELKAILQDASALAQQLEETEAALATFDPNMLGPDGRQTFYETEVKFHRTKRAFMQFLAEAAQRIEGE